MTWKAYLHLYKSLPKILPQVINKKNPGMKKHKQEDMSNWMEEAKAIAKAERELGIEKWVILSIEYQTKDYRRVVLFQYDPAASG